MFCLHVPVEVASFIEHLSTKFAGQFFEICFGFVFGNISNLCCLDWGQNGNLKCNWIRLPKYKGRLLSPVLELLTSSKFSRADSRLKIIRCLSLMWMTTLYAVVNVFSHSVQRKRRTFDACCDDWCVAKVFSETNVLLQIVQRCYQNNKSGVKIPGRIANRKILIYGKNGCGTRPMKFRSKNIFQSFI